MSADILRHFKLDKWALPFILFLVAFLPLVGHSLALVYLFFFLWCLLLGCLIDNISIKPLKIGLFALLIASMTIFVGLRDFGVGFDTNIYVMRYFKELQGISSVKGLLFANFDGDRAFLFLAYISKCFSDNPQFFLVVIAFFIYLVSFLAIVKTNECEKKINWFVFLFLYFFSVFHESLNLMRQYCAMSILLLSFAFLLDNKWLKSLWLVPLAFLFHSSSIIFLPIYLFYAISMMQNEKKKKILIVSTILVGFVLVSNFLKLLPFLGGMGVVSDDYANRYGMYSNFESANLFGPVFCVTYAVICYIIWLSYKKKAISNQFMILSVGVHSLYFVLRLAAFYVIYLSRLSMYFFYCDVFLLAIILSKNVIPTKTKFLLYLCLVYRWLNGCIYQAGGATYPYTSYILGITC